LPPPCYVPLRAAAAAHAPEPPHPTSLAFGSAFIPLHRFVSLVRTYSRSLLLHQAIPLPHMRQTQVAWHSVLPPTHVSTLFCIGTFTTASRFITATNHTAGRLGGWLACWQAGLPSLLTTVVRRLPVVSLQSLFQRHAMLRRAQPQCELEPWLPDLLTTSKRTWGWQPGPPP